MRSFLKELVIIYVMNNMLCNKLTPEYVNTATGLELHNLNG